MTILFMDGMDLYGVTSNIGRRYDAAGAATFGAAFGRFGGGGIKMAIDDSYLQKTTPSDPQSIVVSFALFRDTFRAAGSDEVWKLQNGTNDGLISLETIFNSTIINVNRGGSTGTILGTFDMSLNTWHWVSIKVLASNTVGTIDIEVDGINVFTFAGDTVNSGSEFVSEVFFGADNDQDWSYDDIIITDVAGSAPFNDLLPDRRIDTIRPDAAGDSSGFTAVPAVANFLNVDDVTPDDDTSYVESEVSTTKDLYNFGAMAFSPASIDAVNVVALVKNPDSGVTQFKAKVKSGTTEGNGAAQTPLSSYTYMDEVFLLNPDTAAAWTQSEVDGMQAGQEIV